MLTASKTGQFRHIQDKILYYAFIISRSLLTLHRNHY